MIIRASWQCNGFRARVVRKMIMYAWHLLSSTLPPQMPVSVVDRQDESHTVHDLICATKQGQRIYQRSPQVGTLTCALTFQIADHLAIIFAYCLWITPKSQPKKAHPRGEAPARIHTCCVDSMHASTLGNFNTYHEFRSSHRRGDHYLVRPSVHAAQAQHLRRT